MNPKQTKLLTYLGYLVALIAFSWTVFSIFDASFGFAEKLRAINMGWILVAGIFILSAGISFVLLLWQPDIMNWLLIGKSEEERYLNLTPDEKLHHSTLLNNYNLNYLHNELNLLEPIRDLVASQQYERAVSYGVWASSTFLRMNNHLVRIINGLYTLYAVEKLKTATRLQNKAQKQWTFVAYRIRIDDLGWSLYNLDTRQMAELVNYLSNLRTSNGMNISNAICLDNNNKDEAKKQLESIARELRDTKNFLTLACQAYRHLIGINKDEESTYKIYYEQCLKRIHRKDKVIAKAHLLYLDIRHLLGSGIRTEEEYRLLLKKEKKVTIWYLSVNDTMRVAKMYQIRGDIYNQYAQICGENERAEFIKRSYDEYKMGVSFCDEIVRFDEMMENCLAAARCARKLGLGKDNIAYVHKGLKTARFVKNRKMVIEFESEMKPTNILLLRHGESKKNITKTINGNGSLTETGEKITRKRAYQILDYLNSHRIDTTDVVIYGHKDKIQVNETIEILKQVIPDASISYDNRLVHTNFGILSGKSEKDIIGTDEYVQLERWRNGSIPIKELNISGMEPPIDFWKRTSVFLNDVKNKGKFVIIVSTTSVAIQLFHVLMGNDCGSDAYRCVDVPLNGIIHFKENETGEIELNNRDTLTNVAFSEVEEIK